MEYNYFTKSHFKKELEKNAQLELKKIYYTCNFDQKEEFKKLGGRWDKKKEEWYLFENNKNNDNLINDKFYNKSTYFAKTFIHGMDNDGTYIIREDSFMDHEGKITVLKGIVRF